MKKFSYFIIILIAMLIIPFAVYAEEEAKATEEPTEEKADNDSDSKEVPIYFFRGEGCSHCAEAEEWFKSIEEEYGSFFEIKDYETWYDENNSELMNQVAEIRNETADGVPYIIVGNKSWNGFAEEYKEEILDEIKKVFKQDISERYDVMKYLSNGGKKDKKDSVGSDVVAFLIIIIVCGAIGFGIYKARKSTN